MPVAEFHVCLKAVVQIDRIGSVILGSSSCTAVEWLQRFKRASSPHSTSIIGRAKLLLTYSSNTERIEAFDPFAGTPAGNVQDNLDAGVR
jgi:hypothetical protein